jgi:apolipoprotein N-acyltransferase
VWFPEHNLRVKVVRSAVRFKNHWSKWFSTYWKMVACVYKCCVSSNGCSVCRTMHWLCGVTKFMEVYCWYRTAQHTIAQVAPWTFPYLSTLYTVISVTLLMRVHVVTKSVCWLRRFSSSVCPNVSARLPLDGFPWNFILRTYMKICRDNPSLVNILHFTWRPKCVLMSPATSAVFWCNGIRLLG